MVYSGALMSTAFLFTIVYNMPLSIFGEAKPGDSKRPNYVICNGEERKAVVELKSPNVFQMTDTVFFSMENSFDVVLKPNASTVAQKVINKVSILLVVSIVFH